LLAQIRSTLQRLAQTQKQYYPSVRAALQDDGARIIHKLEQFESVLNSEEFSSATKKECGHLLRILSAQVAAFLSGPNWQSPSFWHTHMPQAGMESGIVSASKNDYKRDMHVYEQRYGASFVQEYIEHPLRLAPQAYPTSSGMSAVTTVLAYLRSTTADQRVVLVGKSTYFQNKWQLEHFFPGCVRYVDEFATDEIVRMATELQPAVVFLDSLCGAVTLPMPNLSKLVPSLARVLGKSSTLVIDNTVMATMYQPLRDLPLRLFGMKFMVIESLLKYHQFGFDRVTGGIIWAPVGSEDGLFAARMHLGTIIPDASVHALPPPNRALFDARLLRIGRNAQMLAKRLHEYTNKHGIEIIHPSLPQYRGNAWTRDAKFQGPFVTLQFPEKLRHVAHYDAFVRTVQKAASGAGVDIVGGTSFGFDTTRLYVTARYATNITEPFVRIAVGTETIDEIEQLADVFVQAI
jgi:cystathionine beta-lyase/cystathionine gamma-synthase